MRQNMQSILNTTLIVYYHLQNKPFLTAFGMTTEYFRSQAQEVISECLMEGSDKECDGVVVTYVL